MHGRVAVQHAIRSTRARILNFAPSAVPHSPHFRQRQIRLTSFSGFTVLSSYLLCARQFAIDAAGFPMSDGSGALNRLCRNSVCFRLPRVRTQAAVRRQECGGSIAESIDEPEKFWGRMAAELVDQALGSGAGVEIAPCQVVRRRENQRVGGLPGCADRQGEWRQGRDSMGRRKRPAGSGGSIHRMSFRQLRDDVCRLANALKKLGVKKGDRVTIYMPMVPETASRDACVQPDWAPHSVIFRWVRQPGDCRSR